MQVDVQSGGQQSEDGAGNTGSGSSRRILLAVETSCDDTACALVDDGGRVLSSVVSSQMVHAPYGGVVPELASREHLRNWPAVLEGALEQSGVSLDDVDLVAATRGPGLIGALLVGLHLGKSLAFGLGCDFRAVHHLEGHLYSPFLRDDGEAAREIPGDFVGLVVSGGHTSLVGVSTGADGARHIEALGETRDDAMGEAMDKVGKRLGLPFPAGPHVDRLSELVSLDSAGERRFRVPRLEGLDFSYSGLKTQALREIEALERAGVRSTPDPEADADDPTRGLPAETLELIAAFRFAAVRQLLSRIEQLHGQRPFEHLAVSGGVAACRELRRQLQIWSDEQGVSLHLVPLRFCGDNAAMIAFAALLAGAAEAGDEAAGPVAGATQSVQSVRSALASRAQSRWRLGD